MNAKMNRTAWLIVSIVATCITVACGSPKDIYVNCDPKPRYVKEDGTMKYPFRTIQQGIKDAVDGDRVKVYPGVYKLWPGSTGIDFDEKKIAIVSMTPNDPAATIIEGQGIRVTKGQGPESQIRGFTIRGGGIYLENSDPAIVQCIFEYNPVRAITCNPSNARIQNCIFIGNTVPGSDAAGGAIWCSGGNAEILDCTFMGNGAAKGGAIAIGSGSPIIRNCILWGNASLGTGDSQIFVAAAGATPSILYCDIQGGTGQWWFGSGNIDVDPLLTAAGFLCKGSPCIGVGTADLPADATATDIHGGTRPIKTPPDMGADEWSDIDADGLPDFWEKRYFGDQTAADPAADSDNDGLPNLKEYEASTDPTVADTDGDGWNDGREVACGANPRRRNLYVDGAKGNDDFDGRAPNYEGGTHGPVQTIQLAIVKAEPGETVILAPGIYSGSGDCDLDFSKTLPWGGRVITVQSQDPFDPNIVAATVIDPNQKGRAFYFHDVHSPLSCVQGLTLRNGRADLSMPGDACGGAILLAASSPTIAHCTITGNLAMSHGGGLYGTRDVSAPTIIDCDIHGNEARGNGGGIACCAGPIIHSSITQNSAVGMGGGMWNDHERSSPLFIDCTIASNTAGEGGAVSNDRISAQTFVNCRFAGNRAGGGGGAIHNYYSSPTLGNCIFSGNSSGWFGGGIWNENAAEPTLWNCTFTGNVAFYGGGVAAIFCSPTLTNCIFFSNSDSNGDSEVPSTAVINYCCVQNWSSSAGGVGNIGGDPCFVDPGHWDSNGTPNDPNDDFWVDGDYHLKSQADRWNPKTQTWVKDSVTSPCIDAGDPNSSVADEPMPNGGRINMGAYGGTAEASKSYP